MLTKSPFPLSAILLLGVLFCGLAAAETWATLVIRLIRLSYQELSLIRLAR